MQSAQVRLRPYSPRGRGPRRFHVHTGHDMLVVEAHRRLASRARRQHGPTTARPSCTTTDGTRMTTSATAGAKARRGHLPARLGAAQGCDHAAPEPTGHRSVAVGGSPTRDSACPRNAGRSSTLPRSTGRDVKQGRAGPGSAWRATGFLPCESPLRRCGPDAGPSPVVQDRLAHRPVRRAAPSAQQLAQSFLERFPLLGRQLCRVQF